MRGDGWDNRIFDDWDDFYDLVEFHGVPSPDPIIVGGLPWVWNERIEKYMRDRS